MNHSTWKAQMSGLSDQSGTSAFADDDVVVKAIRRYCRDRRNEGLPPCQPSRYLTHIDGGEVIVESLLGELARYRVTPSGQLRRSERLNLAGNPVAEPLEVESDVATPAGLCHPMTFPKQLSSAVRSRVSKNPEELAEDLRVRQVPSVVRTEALSDSHA